MEQIKKRQLLHTLYTLKSFGYHYHKPINQPSKQLKTISLPNNLAELTQTISNCHLCKLNKLKTNNNIDKINPNSNIVFITTTPLQQYDLLNKMLENVLNISMNDISLLSIIKCNINTMAPSSITDEIDICKRYIIQQLLILKPKLIVTLGESYKHLLNSTESLSLLRGTLLEYDGATLIPIYHPDVLLRNPSLKKESFEDLKKIKLTMDNI